MNESQNVQSNVHPLSLASRRVVNDITVIIPTLGRPILERCLQAIAKGNTLPASIIVVDQGDNPAVADWLNTLSGMGLETRHLRSMKRSASSARNQGIEQVQTNFVAAIDDDCLVEVDWLEKMEYHLHQNPEAIVSG